MSFETNQIYGWPESEEKIWLNPYFFLNNWSSNLIIKSRWLTDISVNRNAGEVRVGLVDRPYRTITAHYTGMKRNQVLDHQMMLARMGKARFWFPLYSDVSHLTDSVLNTSTTTTTIQPLIIPCDTTNKRFYPNKYIAIVKVDTQNKSRTPLFDIIKISAVYDSYIVAVGGLKRNYPIGSKVFSLIIGKLLISENKNAITDQISDGEITVSEIIGKYSLPASSNNKEITTDYSTIVSPIGEEYPILNVRPDWKEASIGWKRESNVNQSGRGEILQTYGDRPLTNKINSFTFLDRKSAFDFLKIFDSRRGRLHPFFIFSDFNEYSEIHNISTDRKQILIEYTGPKINWIFRPYIGIRLKNGTCIIRKVCDVLSTSTTTYEPLSTTKEPNIKFENVCLETSLPTFNLSDVNRLHVSYLVRFGSDELEESWVTDSIMQCDVSFVELDEKEIEYEINYYGTSTTTLEPTTTPGPTTTPQPPGFVTYWLWNGGSPQLQDTNRTEEADYWNGAILTMTSGAATGSYGTVVDWGGPGAPGWWYFLLGDLHPATEWMVEIGDSYTVEFPPTTTAPP